MDIDLDLNFTNLSWTIPHIVASILFCIATRRTWARLKTAEDALAPESILWAARLLFLMCLILAGFATAQTLVGILAIFRVPGGALGVLLVGGYVLCLAAGAEIWSAHCMNVAIRRETSEGLWGSIKIPQVPPE